MTETNVEAIGTFFDYVLSVTLANEGGLLENAAASALGDPGGETYKGITKVTLTALGIEKNPRDLTDDEVRSIYLENYWRIKGGPRSIVPESPAVALCVFDAGVQHGPRRAIRWLQKAIGTKPDGIIGGKTRDAVRYMGEGTTLIRFHEIRRLHLTRWVQMNADRLPLLTGLIGRVDLMLRTGLHVMLDDCGHRKVEEEFNGIALTRAF